MPPTDIQRRMLRRVVHTFLESGKSTAREDLVVEFESLNDLNDLAYRNVLKTYVPGGQDYLPTALAFHYCGDTKAEDQARKAVQLLATVLRKQFLSRRIKLSRGGLEEDGRGVDPSCDLRMIELGVYLSADFYLFQQYSGGNQAQPIIQPAVISEQIVEIKTPNTLWDDRMAVWKPWPVSGSSEDITPLIAPIEFGANQQESKPHKHRWTRDQKIAFWGVVLATIIGSITIVVAVTVPEFRLLLHLDKSPSLQATPSAGPIPSDREKQTPRLNGEFAKDVRELRALNHVVRIDDSESEKPLTAIPNNSFGFVTGNWFGVEFDFKLSDIPVRPRGNEMFFEVHKLQDGSILLVGYVGDETRERLREGLSPGDKMSLYSDPWKDAENLVAVRFDRLKCGRDREIDLGSRGKYLIAVDALDCQVQ